MQMVARGVQYDTVEGATAVDVLLVRHTLGGTTGWELVLPRVCTMAFWIALVYAGARVVGVDDMRELAREACLPYFPDDYPDTPTGREWAGTVRRWTGVEF